MGFEDLAHDGPARHRYPAVENHGTGEKRKSSSLMCGSQPSGNHVDQSADTERGLHPDQMDHAHDTLLSVSGDLVADSTREAGVGKEGQDSGECGGSEDTVVKLH